MSEARAELPEGWEWVKLSDVAEINPRRSQKLEREDDALTTFVPMPAVDDLTGAITAPEIKTFGEVKKGYTYFEEGDVIFAKITPCMQNGKHAVAYNLLDGFAFGSTEFHVIRPGESVIPEWIHFFVRQPSVLYDAEGRMTGAVGQQRVPKEFLVDLEIPLPPLEEQKRVLETLYLQMAEVDKARAATEAQLETINALPAALLRQAFSGELVRPPVVPASALSLEETFMLRCAFASLAVHAFHYDLNRTKLMKFLYLLECYVGLELNGKYRRHKFGPYDDAIKAIERMAMSKGWFKVGPSYMGSVSYTPDVNIDEALLVAQEKLGNMHEKLEKLLTVFSSKQTTTIEVMTTLFAVWNDSLLNNREPSLDEVLHGFRFEWDEEKKKFGVDMLKRNYRRLVKEGLVPSGIGPSTRSQYVA